MWNRKESPLRIEKRFEFDNYQKISKFMKIVDDLCKSKKIYPNISFGKSFVSFTIVLDNEKINNKEEDFSKNIDNIFQNLSS